MRREVIPLTFTNGIEGAVGCSWVSRSQSPSLGHFVTYVCKKKETLERGDALCINIGRVVVLLL